MYPIKLKEKLVNIVLNLGKGCSLKFAIKESNTNINDIKNLTAFLNQYSILPERVYCIINDINIIQKCKGIDCNNTVRFKRLIEGYSLFCSNKCAGNSPIIREKTKLSNIEKYGSENTFQVEKFKDKCKQTCIERYGVENASQSQEIKDKKIKTCLGNFGVKFPMESKEILEKSKITCLEKYGVDNVSKSDVIIDKIRLTHISKYGLEYKSGYKYKDYIFPSGRIQKIQGYENKFLDEYFLNGGEESNILVTIEDITKEIGKTHYRDKNNKLHIYHPDIYIKSENKIIEVKSNWTYNNHKDINELKKQACLDKGLNFEFKIY